jgi:arylsulfatase A-like enzyme/Tfp pilus assembly protein PilF
MGLRRLSALIICLACSNLDALAAPRNVVLITLDTTRADRMGFLGSKRGLTPNLDALAKQSLIFTRAYSQVPLTTSSHATILTGTYPQFHKVTGPEVPLTKELPYLPVILRQHGYATAAFVSSVILDPRAGGHGFDRGFVTYDAGFHSRRLGEDRYKTLERRGEEVVAHASAWLNNHRASPFFIWIHLFDPHAPYDPPEPFKSRYASELYDGEIAYTDSVVGKFLDELRAHGLFDDAIIVAMADHGEALGEHGERGHGIFLYDPTIHVPLLFKLPRESSGGKKIEAPAGLVDVTPTILQVLGFPIPRAIQGKSLLPAPKTNGGKTSDRSIYAETDYPRQFGWSSLRSLRRGKYLFISAPRKELYDENSDASSEHDVASKYGAVTSTLAAALDKFRQQTASSATKSTGTLDSQQSHQLRALGYLSSDDHTSTITQTASGTDPKDKIEIANQMTEANLAMEDGRLQDAVRKLQDVIAKDATFSPAYTALGEIFSSTGDLGRAIPALRKAVELRPNSVSAHYSLGMALFQAGDFKDAAPQFEAAVARNPKSAEMHYSLASIYVRTLRMDDARKELQESLVIKPDFYDANLMLGHIFIVQKKPLLAIPYLQKASKSKPGASDPHRFLGEAYSQLGKEAQAERERALAERNPPR